MKASQRLFLVILIIVAFGFLIAIPLSLEAGPVQHLTVAKLVGSSGLVFDIAGIIQLEASGAFDSLLERYGDIERYPYGPPSHITRQIIDNPDAPIRTAARNFIFFEHRTGILLLLIGFFLQLSAVWIWI
ncbi:hypothetical protein XI06_14090 [Bradyrhizobium sp. CCBAU 11434]|uniref:hypothetical protein n=1 Tax=Bradyrhizobium sp. CCBAU 11434 TaxID=1630885 RepID=UPI0023061CF7|nr:hypothetical protein [Bradyrhizobium sp. CCBAU 11434]MDA9521453.1 hypothetical protein [Bradyrhizobium sp. CCBAU 11434]